MLNKKDLDTLNVACMYLKLRGFANWQEMYNILDKITKMYNDHLKISRDIKRRKRQEDPNYGRSKTELEKRKQNVE